MKLPPKAWQIIMASLRYKHRKNRKNKQPKSTEFEHTSQSESTFIVDPHGYKNKRRFGSSAKLMMRADGDGSASLGMCGRGKLDYGETAMGGCCKFFGLI